jgi:hypothetical protein
MSQTTAWCFSDPLLNVTVNQSGRNELSQRACAMLARLAPTQPMSKSQDSPTPEFDLDQFKRHVYLGASVEEEAIDLLINRFGERIIRRVLVGMYQNGKTFEQSSVDFMLACMNVSCDRAYACAGAQIEERRTALTDEESD